MNLVDRLKSSHSMLGDPLHREAWEKIEYLTRENKNLADALKHMVRWHDQLTPTDVHNAKQILQNSLASK